MIYIHGGEFQKGSANNFLGRILIPIYLSNNLSIYLSILGVYCFIEQEQMGHARDEEGCLSVVSPSAPGEEEEAGKQPSTSCQHQC